MALIDISKITNRNKTSNTRYLILEIMRVSLDIHRSVSLHFDSLYIKKSVPILFDQVVMVIVLDGVAGYFNRGKLPRTVEDRKRYCRAAIIREDVNFSALFDSRIGDLMRRYGIESSSKETDDQKVEVFFRKYDDSFIIPLMDMIEDLLNQKMPDELETDNKLLRPDLYIKYDKCSPSKIAFTSVDDTLIKGKDDKDKQVFLFLKVLKSLTQEIVRNIGILDEIKRASNQFHKALEIALGVRPLESDRSIWEGYFSSDIVKGLYFCESNALEGIINNLISLPKNTVREAIEMYKCKVPNSEICMRGALVLHEEYNGTTSPNSYGYGGVLERRGRQIIEEQPMGYVDAMHELLCKLFFEGEERYAIEVIDSQGNNKRIKDLIGEYYHTTTDFKLTSFEMKGIGYESPREYTLNVEVTFQVVECM